MVLITAEENGRIMLADWAAGLFVRDWALRNRLRLRFTDLNDALMWDEERFEDLWHSILGGCSATSGTRVTGPFPTCGARTSPATIRQFQGSPSIQAWGARRTW